MSFSEYPKYKESGVEWLGEVPVHWEVKRLRYVAVLNPSKAEVRSLPDEQPVSFIPMEAVGEGGSLSLEQTRPLNEVLAGYTYVREGDVTIAKITPCFENEKGAVMRGLESGIGFGTTELTVMRPKTGLTTSDYLYRIVSSEPFRVTGESSMYGAGGQKRVPDDFVRNFTIAWPPYTEQLEIQAFLDHETARIDALIDEQQRLIALLKEKRQAVISHAVTKGLDPDAPMKDSGVEWLGDVPAHWDISPLKWKLESNDGGAWGEDPTGEGDTCVLRSTDQTVDGRWKITDPAFRCLRLKEKNATTLKVGDLVVTKSSGSSLHIGKTTLVNHEVASKDASFGNFMQRIRTKSSFLPKLAWYFMNNKLARLQLDFLSNSTTGLANLNGTVIGEVRIATPPVEEQIDVVNFLDYEIAHINALINEGQQGIDLLQERRSALISSAVTGKIDVRGWQAGEQVEPEDVPMAAEPRATYQ